MTDSIFESLDILNNPYIKILDPACGCGYFLDEAYNKLYEIYIRDIEIINARYPELNLKLENIHEHIIKNNIFGADIDIYAVKLSVINLMMKKPSSIVIPYIVCCDSIINWEDTLLEGAKFWENKFDIIIGNPPYIGHKKMSGDYRKTLNNIYGDIFKGKADISFCFIKSSIDRLSSEGRLCFITSRYFIESSSGKPLRRYIKTNCKIERIIDFYGVRIMKGISIDPVIIFLKKSDPVDDDYINVTKAEATLKKVKSNNVFNEIIKKNDKYFKFFLVPQIDLDDDGWILCNESETSIIKKIECRLSLRLMDICESFQGIITGCDKAFIIDNDKMKELNIENDIIKKWIKNSYIKKYKVEHSNLNIIYSDFIQDIFKYPAAISYIEPCRLKLEMRRECISGARKWYQLQWGRDYKLFDMRKIIFPYKSASNRFAIDEGSYSSADVYGLYLKEKYSGTLSYEFLIGVLNSKLYEFYFKSFAKKLGDDMYEYYPNTVLRLKVLGEEDSYITNLVRQISDCNDEDNISDLIININRRIYEIFELTNCEIDIIESRV